MHSFASECISYLSRYDYNGRSKSRCCCCCLLQDPTGAYGATNKGKGTSDDGQYQKSDHMQVSLRFESNRLCLCFGQVRPDAEHLSRMPQSLHVWTIGMLSFGTWTSRYHHFINAFDSCRMLSSTTSEREMYGRRLCAACVK